VPASLKEKIHNHCLKLLEEKIFALNTAMENISEALTGETKNTAGDKHETARAILQLEQEKLGRQVKEISDQKAGLEKTDFSQTTQQITKGTLIESNKGFLYFCIGLGKITVDNINVFAISPQSPLGQKLTGKKENDVVEMNGVKYAIEKLH